MAWLRNRFQNNQLRFAVSFALLTVLFGFAFLGVADIAISKSNTSKIVLVQDSGLSCRFDLNEPWQSFMPIFGLSSVVYQELPKDDEVRAMLAFVITPMPGNKFESDDIEKEYESFRKGKADYVQSEGGTFIGAAESLKGENGIYRISVRYQIDGQKLQDSSYFFFRNGRLFHAKALFDFTRFDAMTIEQQTLNLLAGVKCQVD